MDIQNKNFWVDGLNNFKNTMPKPINPNSKSCVLPQCSSCYWVYWIFLLVIILIFVHWFFLSKTFGKEYKCKDLLNHKIVDRQTLGKDCCSGWLLSHFVLFFILGFFFPDCIALLIIAGVLWEIVEYVIGIILKKRSNGEPSYTITGCNVQYKDVYITGSLLDIIADVSGIFIGVGLRLIIDPYLPESWQYYKDK